MQNLLVLNMIFLILIFILIVIGIYGFVLFIRLAHRGIKAFDIYIEKNSKDKIDK